MRIGAWPSGSRTNSLAIVTGTRFAKDSDTRLRRASRVARACRPAPVPIETSTMDIDTLSAENLQHAARQQANWAIGALKQFSENRCAAMAASIAFYAAFSLAPTLVMVIAVSGWFFGAEAARGELFRQVHSVLGNDAAAAVTTIVQNAHRSGGAGGVAAIISFVLLAVGASATFSSLNSALNIVWPSVTPRASSVFALVRVRLISFGLVLGVAFLLIVSLVLDTAITFIGNWIWGDSPYVVIGN